MGQFFESEASELTITHTYRVGAATRGMLVGLQLCLALLLAAGCADDAADTEGPGALDGGQEVGVDADADISADAAAPDTGGDAHIDAVTEDTGPDTRVGDADAQPFDGGEDSGEDAGSTDAHMTWRLDGDLVYEATSHEAGYLAGQNTVYVYMPHWGRNVQIDITGASDATAVDLQCGDDWGTANLSLTTSDNGHSRLDDVPTEWQGLVLNEHHCQNAPSSGDQITRWELTLTHVGADRVAGSFAMTIDGAQERAGSTLTIAGTFDVEPDA